jgi:hypothetical protein
MSYVEGTDLASLLAQEGPLEPERALAIVSQLAEAVDAARWGRGLVHGGLTPSEVLVTPAEEAEPGERILLGGFGLRPELPSGGELAQAAQRLGAIDYIAPEQIEGRPVSPRTDVYALGCLLFECLTGKPPFSGSSPDAILQAHLREAPPSVRRYSPGLPAAIDRVIGKALAKWPEERYSTCTELAAAAREAVAGRARPEQSRRAIVASARPTQTESTEQSPFEAEETEVVAPNPLATRLATKRRKAIAVVSLAALLALVAGAIWLMNDRRSTSREPPPGPEPAAAQTLDEVAIEAGEGTATPPLDDAEARRQPSHRQFLAWLDAFNGGVRGTYRAFLEAHFPNRLRGVLAGADAGPEGATDQDMSLRELTGGFELPKLEEVSADHVRGRLQARNSLEPYQFELGVAPTEPHKILYLLLEPIGEPAESPTNDPSEPVLSRVPGSLVRIDAKTGKILARLAIPSPKLLASNGRSVWVLSDDEPGDRLIRIDAATNAVTANFNADVVGAAAEFGATTEPSVPTELAVAGGSAWLGVSSGPVYRFSPGASAGEAALTEGPSPWFSPWFGEPFAAAGSVWVRNGEGSGGVLRVDPVTGRILADFSSASVDQVVAAGRGFVWALAGTWGDNPHLARIDTETNAVSPLDAPDWPWLDFAVADGAVWASGPQPGTIVRLDPVTGEVEGEIDVVPSPSPIAGGGGAVWAANRNDGTVARYDIATRRVRSIDVGGIPTDLVVARGSVWVAVQERLGGDGSGASAGTEEDWEILSSADRHVLTVNGAPLSFSVPTGGWERFGSTSINKSTQGPQDAEAIIYWKTFPSGDNGGCPPLVGASVADLAAAVASAPGTELVRGPSDATVGERPAKHVVLTVREDLGCDPGFFFTWPNDDRGAFWLETRQGDTIRVWIVDVDGTRLFIGAETQPDAGSDVEREIEQIIESIRFD